jgi:4-amino-4-deoxy-L-arabinose transferase-like glycosyltransferase
MLRGDSSAHLRGLAFFASVAIGLRLIVAFAQPFRPDELLHIHHAWMVSQGKLPYRDFFDHHACLYHFLLAPFANLFSPEQSMTSAMGFLFFSRLFSALTGMAALYFLYRIGKQWSGKQVGLVAVILVLGVPLFLETSIETRPDVPALLLWMVSLLFVLRGICGNALSRRNVGSDTATCNPSASCVNSEPSGLWLFPAAGVLLGVAVMLTQKLLFVLPGIGITFGLWLILEGGRDQKLASVLLFIIGLVFPLGCTWVFFAAQGSGTEFIDNVFLINARWAFRILPSVLLQRFWSESWVFVAIGTAGAIWICTAMFISRRWDWPGTLLQATVIGWLVGLCWIIPVADAQFYLIPLPLMALLGARYLSDLSNRYSRFIALPLIWLLLSWEFAHPVTLTWERIRAGWLYSSTLAQVSSIAEITKSSDSVLDGWTGMGVFRPQAWYYGFVHLEIPPMIPQRDRELLMRGLESGEIRPKVIAKDDNLLSLHSRLIPWIERHYHYNSTLGAYVRDD